MLFRRWRPPFLNSHLTSEPRVEGEAARFPPAFVLSSELGSTARFELWSGAVEPMSLVLLAAAWSYQLHSRHQREGGIGR